MHAGTPGFKVHDAAMIMFAVHGHIGTAEKKQTLFNVACQTSDASIDGSSRRLLVVASSCISSPPQALSFQRRRLQSIPHMAQCLLNQASQAISRASCSPTPSLLLRTSPFLAHNNLHHSDICATEYQKAYSAICKEVVRDTCPCLTNTLENLSCAAKKY